MAVEQIAGVPSTIGAVSVDTKHFSCDRSMRFILALSLYISSLVFALRYSEAVASETSVEWNVSSVCFVIQDVVL